MKLLGKMDILEIAVACGLFAGSLFMLACFLGVMQYMGNQGICK